MAEGGPPDLVLTGRKKREECIPALGGGRRGTSSPDLTFEGPSGRVRINTVDTYADGSMTAREHTNFTRIFEQRQEPIIAIVKPV